MSHVYVFSQEVYATPLDAQKDGALSKTSLNIGQLSSVSPRFHENKHSIAEIVNTCCHCLGLEKGTLAVCFINDDAKFENITGEIYGDAF